MKWKSCRLHFGTLVGMTLLSACGPNPPAASCREGIGIQALELCFGSPGCDSRPTDFGTATKAAEACTTLIGQRDQKGDDVARLLRYRGNAYAAARYYDRAIQDFDRVIALRPGDGQAYLGRGTANLLIREDDRALHDLDEAIALRLDNASLAVSYNNRGVVRAFKGRDAEAMDDFNRAIALQPDLAEAYYNRSMTRHDWKGIFSDLATELKLTLGFKVRTPATPAGKPPANSR